MTKPKYYDPHDPYHPLAGRSGLPTSEWPKVRKSTFLRDATQKAAPAARKAIAKAVRDALKAP